MNIVRTTVKTVAVQPNGSPRAPYIQGLVQSGCAKIEMKRGYLKEHTLFFERSEQIFEFMEALRVLAEHLRDDEEAARARGTKPSDHPEGDPR